ncbi:MAG: hypothetical protein P8L44_10890 [Opitutales bacterium]|jgi:hypothetical protein|nr:hypothetical protein [Opitutales bacterium]
MRTFISSCLVFLTGILSLQAINHDILVIVGAAGEEKYAEGFSEAAQAWVEAGEKAEAEVTVIGLEHPDDTNDKDRIKDWIQNLDTTGTIPAWVVYIGHGTHNRRDAYLNLRGPDLSAGDMEVWLPTMSRTFIMIHGGSAGSEFLTSLTGRNRILISATRNPDEINYARFGEFFADVISNDEGDIDQDGQTSLLEAFLTTANYVDAFYTGEARLSSEHSLLDDNGDKLGTPPDWFRGTRVTKRAKGGQEPDGFRSHQIALIPSELEKLLSSEQRIDRDGLEAELELLRKRKDQLEEEEYYEALEVLLLQLSSIYLKTDDQGNLVAPSIEEEGS